MVNYLIVVYVYNASVFGFFKVIICGICIRRRPFKVFNDVKMSLKNSRMCVA